MNERLSAALADRYTIERELGAGGMATVYLAHDLKHDRDVAIKVLHPDLGAALGSDRFLSEIRTTARLQHPHSLPLLDSGNADGLLYYVMPVVTGETLRARLTRDQQLPIPETVRHSSRCGMYRRMGASSLWSALLRMRRRRWSSSRPTATMPASSGSGGDIHWVVESLASAAALRPK
jgi:hypothetical protein